MHALARRVVGDAAARARRSCARSDDPSSRGSAIGRRSGCASCERQVDRRRARRCRPARPRARLARASTKPSVPSSRSARAVGGEPGAGLDALRAPRLMRSVSTGRRTLTVSRPSMTRVIGSLRMVSGLKTECRVARARRRVGARQARPQRARQVDRLGRAGSRVVLVARRAVAHDSSRLPSFLPLAAKVAAGEISPKRKRSSPYDGVGLGRERGLQRLRRAEHREREARVVVEGLAARACARRRGASSRSSVRSGRRRTNRSCPPPRRRRAAAAAPTRRARPPRARAGRARP